MEINDNQFREQDEWISRFIWQGKQPRIRFSILQLRKESGGMALPCLRNYFFCFTDKRFESRVRKGLATYLSFTHKNTIQSFQYLQETHGLGKSDFFRCLQLRLYFNQKCREKWGGGKEAGVVISEEAWGGICSFQWSSANSMEWKGALLEKHSKIL